VTAYRCQQVADSFDCNVHLIRWVQEGPVYVVLISFMVNLVRIYLTDDLVQTQSIRNVTLDQVEVRVADVVAYVVERIFRRVPIHAMDFIAFLQQDVSKIRTVLATDASDESTH
jgi:hypothetical protein